MPAADISLGKRGINGLSQKTIFSPCLRASRSSHSGNASDSNVGSGFSKMLLRKSRRRQSAGHQCGWAVAPIIRGWREEQMLPWGLEI
jgi:hypothetical protein